MPHLSARGLHHTVWGGDVTVACKVHRWRRNTCWINRILLIISWNYQWYWRQWRRYYRWLQ